MYLKQLRLFLGLLLFCLTSPCLAQQIDREALGEDCYKAIHDKDIQVDEETKRGCLEKAYERPVLVITPTRRERNLADVPASAAVVEGEQLEGKSFDGVAEALRDVPGVEITDAGQAGQKRIRIRGEDSRRVTILIDGQEFADQRDVGTPLLIAPEMIERIEVLRGTGSVLHGSRAIGGVINIITKKGGYHPIQGSASSAYSTATDGHQEFASVFGSLERLDYRLAGTVANHHDREAPGGKVENTAFDNDSVLAYLGKQWDKHRLAATFDAYHSSSQVYVAPEVRTAPPFVDFRINAPERDREKAGIFYDGEELGEVVTKVHLDAYYQTSDRGFDTFTDSNVDAGSGPILRSTSILTDSTMDTVGGNGQLDFKLGEFNYLIVGLKTTDDSLKQKRSREVITAGVSSPKELIKDEAKQSSFELFSQDELSVVENIKITGGLRGYWVDTELENTTRPSLDPSSPSDEHIIGAVGLSYSGIDHSTLWIDWSQGYVFPTLINLATGAFAGPDFVNPNSDLDSETANTFEVGARSELSDLALESAVFYTVADNYIDHVLCSSTSASCVEPTGSRDRVYINVDEARTFGAEVSMRLDYAPFTPYANFTWLRRRFETPTASTYDTGVPELFGRTGLEYDQEVGSDVTLFVDGYLRLATDSDERDSKGNTIHDAGWGTTNISIGATVGRTKNHDLKLSLDLLNLGDKEYTPGGENLVASGRSAIIKLAADL